MLKVEGNKIIYDTPDELEAYKLGYEEGFRDGLKKGTEIEHAKTERNRIMENIDREWDERKRRETEHLRQLEEIEKERRIRNEIWGLRNAAYSNRKW